MIDYLLFSTGYWCWCIIYFIIIQKPLFYFLNSDQCPQGVQAKTVYEVYRHGGVSDAIVSCYMCGIPFTVGLLHALFPAINLASVMLPYNVIVCLAVGLLSLSDAVLYSFWGSKIESSVFSYLTHPRSVFASVSGGYLVTALVSWLLLSAVFFSGACYISEISETYWPTEVAGWWQYAVAPLEFILLVGISFVVIRGLKIRPNNPSVVYFSPHSFYNHWALNPGYNLIYSLGTRNEYHGLFQAFDPQEARSIVEPLFPTEGNTTTKLLKTERPNVLVIVWESYGAEFCGAIGGRENVTPRFNALCREGVLFTNCVSSSFRTDRAQPAIFCGLPGQPTTSIVRHARKLQNLPAWPADLREAGYKTMAIHASDLTVMHMSEFFLSSGHTELVDENDFPKDAKRCKWGVHDRDMFSRVYDEIMKKTSGDSPWLTTVLTLSSHEPFVVPYNRFEDGPDNSMAYTDDAVGEFVDRLKKTPVWDNLLVMIVADHSLNRVATPENRAKYAHIPLLLTGGAVKGPMEIDTLMCQTDIAATLLAQMNLPHDKYPFSRDVLADSYKIPSAMHTYINGFLFTDESGNTDFDNVSGKPVNGTDDTVRERRGKAILQLLYDYIDKLG